MGNIYTKVSLNIKKCRTEIYPRVSYKISKFCSEICVVDDDKHVSPPTTPINNKPDIKININTTSSRSKCNNEDSDTSLDSEYLPSETCPNALPKRTIIPIPDQITPDTYLNSEPKQELERKLANLKEPEDSKIDEPDKQIDYVNVSIDIKTIDNIELTKIAGIQNTSSLSIDSDDDWDKISNNSTNIE